MCMCVFDARIKNTLCFESGRGWMGKEEDDNTVLKYN